MAVVAERVKPNILIRQFDGLPSVRITPLRKTIQSSEGKNESHEAHKSLEEKLLSIIKKGKFEDHPEVLKWWTSRDKDSITTTYAALKKNIFQAEQPAKPLNECGDVNFLDTNGSLHFHGGIADWQKRRLLEVVSVRNATPDEQRTRQTERMYQKAVAVLSVLFRGHADFDSLEGELRQAKDEASIASVLDKIGTKAINTVNTLYPDKKILVGHQENEENHEKAEKLNWDQRLQTATKLIVTSALHSEDPRMQEQFQKVSGKGFLGKIDLAEQLPEALVKQNKELTTQFVETLKAARAENPNLDVNSFVAKLAQIHDQSISGASVDNYQDKNIQFTNKDAIKIFALHLEILSRVEGIKISPEQLAKEQNIHILAKQLQSKGINFVNINGDHSTAYHMELRPLLVGPNNKPTMQMELCPHSEQADQMLTETVQQVQQIEQSIQREIQMQQVPLSQPPLDRLYPPPHFAKANHNHLGEQPPHSHVGNSLGLPTVSSFSLSHSPSSNSGSERSGSKNSIGEEQKNQKPSKETAKSESRDVRVSRPQNNKKSPGFNAPRPHISIDSPKPKRKEAHRILTVHKVSNGRGSSAVLESLHRTRKPVEAVAKIRRTTNPTSATKTEYVNGTPRADVRRVNSGGKARSERSTSTTDTPREANTVSYVINKPMSKDSVRRQKVGQQGNKNLNPETSIPRFRTSTMDVGPRNPQPTKPNPDRSLNNGEAVGKTISNPVEVSTVTIGNTLSKAFEKVEENAKKKATNSTQRKASKKTEAGESLGTSATNKVTVESAGASATASTQEAQDKSESAQVNSTPAATQTSQTRGIASNVTEATGTTSVSARAQQKATSNNASDEEFVVEVEKGTDEKNENAQITQPAPVQKQTTAPTATIQDVLKVKQAGQTAAASLSLSVDNEFLDFTNPHGVGDAFKKAWSQAITT